MGGFSRVAATGTLLAATVLQAFGGAAVLPDGLIVRIYDNAGVLAADRTRAIGRASEILVKADLDIDWRDCSARWTLRGRCAAPAAAGELMVRLVRSPKGAERERALGASVIDSTTGGGTLATVFVDRVESMAGQARADRAGMLGRVIAHEIGHLLLGTNAHAETGLMREIWTFAELTRNRAQDWMFTATQRQNLRDAYIGAKRVTTAATRRNPSNGG
jgi:hypothetical protein